MRFEPGFIATLREQLAGLDGDSLKYVNVNRVLSLASRPDPNTFQHIEHVLPGDVKAGCCHLQNTAQSYNVIESLKPLNGDPITTEHVFSVFENRAEQFTLLGDHGLRLTPAGTLLQENFLHQAGSGILFDLALAKHDSKDSFVIVSKRALSDRDIKKLHGEFLSSNADVVCLLGNRPKISTKPIPVWLNGRIVVVDPRDLDESFDYEHAMYHESGVYLVSAAALGAAPQWTYKKRRYHQARKIWHQFERDLSQLTETFTTSYVI